MSNTEDTCKALCPFPRPFKAPKYVVEEKKVFQIFGGLLGGSAFLVSPEKDGRGDTK